MARNQWQSARCLKTAKPLPEGFASMLKKAFVGLVLLGLALVLAYYVYPTHPVVVWSMLGVTYLCYRLGLRAQRLFKDMPSTRD